MKGWVQTGSLQELLLGLLQTFALRVSWSPCHPFLVVCRGRAWMSLRHVTSELLMFLKDLWTNCALVTISNSLYFKSLIHLYLLLFFL
jgi:hypothetical protein